jgi:nucleotide-binding universal stress UspA family protein
MKTGTLPANRIKLPNARRVVTRKGKSQRLRIENILVPLDFSPASHGALQFALPWLRQLGAKLHLVHVLPSDAPFSAMADLPMVVPDVEIGRRVRRDLGKAAEYYRVRTEPAHLHMRKGTPFAEICALARESAIDLIVIATRGITGLKHVLLGSTAERVVRYSPCPVLVVRGISKDQKLSRNGAKSQRDPTLKRILVPVDFSDASARNLNYAKQLAKEFHATLILLHSVALQPYFSSDEYARYGFPLLMQQSEKVAKRRMRDLIVQTARDGIRVEQSLQIGHAGQEICAHAERDHADLIVTSTHGYTGFKHILLGSTAEYVVRHARCPVLVVPSHTRPAVNSTKLNI